MKDILVRFLDKVNKTNGCWLWTASCREGYGRFWINNKLEQAHRISYILFVGEIPDRLDVLHKCDNPKCVNPEHLFVGTVLDNVHDMFFKNRQAKHKNVGCTNGSLKLCDQDVFEIRASNEAQEILAERYNVSQQTISEIRQRKTWRHL